MSERGFKLTTIGREFDALDHSATVYKFRYVCCWTDFLSFSHTTSHHNESLMDCVGEELVGYNICHVKISSLLSDAPFSKVQTNDSIQNFDNFFQIRKESFERVMFV